jgi:hypothetical protein
MAYLFDKTTSFPKALSFAILLTLVGMLPRGMLAQGDSPAAAQQVSIDPNQLVLQAVHRAVWGPSFSCRVRQRSADNLHQVEAEGHYWQLGQGTGQLKMSLALRPKGSEAITNWLQVSDGRLLWTNMDGEPPRRVYLDRVRQALGSLVRDPGQHPEAALYMAIGGHAEMMRSLYVRYRWNRIVAGTDEHGRDAWQLLGVLRTEAPRPHSITKVDNHLIVATPAPEIPLEVRLTLGRDEKSLFFPYRIDYYRRERTEGGGPGKRILVSTIERDEFVSPISVPPDFFHFQVPDEADQIDDETTDYMPLFPQAEH